VRRRAAERAAAAARRADVGSGGGGSGSDVSAAVGLQALQLAVVEEAVAVVVAGASAGAAGSARSGLEEGGISGGEGIDGIEGYGPGTFFCPSCGLGIDLRRRKHRSHMRDGTLVSGRVGCCREKRLLLQEAHTTQPQ
jgi:hypothetical protein